jgi:alkylation response protein AidB-like acyl-CoA dehydrogenase
MALLAAMPLGLAGNHAHGVDVMPEEHRRAWAEQVDRFAARVRAGGWYAAANSEKGAGGSLEATKTVAALGSDGVWRLDGEKILGSSGRYADYFFSAAKVDPEQLPGCGIVETFFVKTDAPGVEVLSDWDGFGMRPTESNTVRYASAPAEQMWGFPNFLARVQPIQYWYCLFSAVPLGCARAMLDTLGAPAPESPALRLRLSEALMRYESLRAYLGETADRWQAAAGPAYAARVLRTKTYVTQKSVKLCAELFALSGGRHYRRGDALARTLADSFAGTALRPPLALALEQLVQQFSLEGV